MNRLIELFMMEMYHTDWTTKVCDWNDSSPLTVNQNTSSEFSNQFWLSTSFLAHTPPCDHIDNLF